MAFSSANDYSRMGAVTIDESHDYAAVMAYCQDTNNWFKRFRGEWDMDIKKHTFIPCTYHKNNQTGRFANGCHDCLVTSIVRLCELLDKNPNLAHDDESGSADSLTEVFQGTHVAHFTEGRVTNVTALPMSPADAEEGIFRYTVEIRKDG